MTPHAAVYLIVISLTAASCAAAPAPPAGSKAAPVPSCDEYGRGAAQLMVDLATDSSAAEALIAAGAERDFDEAASAQLALEFSRISDEYARSTDLEALGLPPPEWAAVSVELAAVIRLHETAFAEIARSFELRDAVLLGEAALKMTRALEIQTTMGEAWPICER